MGRVLLALTALVAATGADAPVDWRADARVLDVLIEANYAYLDQLPGGRLPDSAALTAAREGVRDRATLLRYAEDRLLTLADHHAITGSSFKDSWALVPTYADLWVEDGRITAVRAGSGAATRGIAVADRLIAVDGEPLDRAVAAFWARLGLPVTVARRDHAARVLAAGRRDRSRTLTLGHDGRRRDIVLPSAYADARPSRPPVTRDGGTIRIHDALGDSATIAAFDAAIAGVTPGAAVTIDLTDTPSGGNTTVARGIMGWFVGRPTAYQLHRLSGEERATGVVRQWVEQVLPRPGKRHRGRITVRVGRWTGSMGEGLAIGLREAGARLCGERMAGLLGAIYDFRLPRADW